MYLFQNRHDAGCRLAEKTDIPGLRAPVVISIPRGGTQVAAPIATKLRAPHYVILPRKIGAPFNPEFAVGALAPDGTAYYNQDLLDSLGLTVSGLQHLVEKEKREIQKRLALYGKWGILPALKGKTLILVDDGIATGQTVKAALLSLRKAEPLSLILAVPVLPADAVAEFSGLVDRLLFLQAPIDFQAVGQFYVDFSETSHEEVVRILED